MGICKTLLATIPIVALASAPVLAKGGGGGGGGGKSGPQIKEINVNKGMDTSSPKMMTSTPSGAARPGGQAAGAGATATGRRTHKPIRVISEPSPPLLAR